MGYKTPLSCLFAIALLNGCAPKSLSPNLGMKDVRSISFSYKSHEFYASGDQAEVAQFLSLFDSAKASKEDFKSFWFVTFNGEEGRRRIEVSENKFRFSGRVYSVRTNLEALCRDKYKSLQ